MISELTVETLPRIAPIGAAFAREVDYPGGFWLEAFSVNWRPLLASGIGKILVAEEDNGHIIGAIGFSFLPDGFSGQRCAVESFWYVHPGYRNTRAGLNLFSQFENEGRAAGVKQLVMVHLAGTAGDKLGAFYESQGYRLVEKTYRKELN